MIIQFFSSGVVLGFLVGLLCSSVVQGQQRRVRGTDGIDRLIEQFQTLFRQIDREKQERP